MIRYIHGDALGPEAPKALAHGCNCQGFMGKGFAKLVRARWPSCYRSYRHLVDGVEDRGSMLGGVHVWRHVEDSDRIIFNLFTQINIGPCASLSAVESCLDLLVREATEQEIRHVAMPWIGCGIGGLRKEQLRPVLDALDTKSLTFHVYEL